jgi:hypothetical protein
VDGLIQPMQMPWRIDYEGNDSFLVPECLLSASAGVVQTFLIEDYLSKLSVNRT